ncbi:hypothetical protein SK128_009248 [Halocaridina rubra]|uniref:Uncharacterized protein n=1 Tax=Halocaridina rubra TaxID=373956 RepID=A0AAN8ZWR9_HALRR
MPVVSNFITSVGGMVILMCFYNANSILVRGAVMDGGEDGCKGIIFPTHYLRFFYKKRNDSERQRTDYWARGDCVRPPLHISAPLESSLSNKANGVCDGRVFSDGRSFVDGFSDTYKDVYDEDNARSQRPTSSFLGPEGTAGARNPIGRTLREAGDPDTQSYQTETPL